jgi:hypothetical protein
MQNCFDEEIMYGSYCFERSLKDENAVTARLESVKLY